MKENLDKEIISILDKFRDGKASLGQLVSLPYATELIKIEEDFKPFYEEIEATLKKAKREDLFQKLTEYLYYIIRLGFEELESSSQIFQESIASQLDKVLRDYIFIPRNQLKEFLGRVDKK